MTQDEAFTGLILLVLAYLACSWWHLYGNPRSYSPFGFLTPRKRNGKDP
jgi:hypothetical protein